MIINDLQKIHQIIINLWFKYYPIILKLFNTNNDLPLYLLSNWQHSSKTKYDDMIKDTLNKINPPLRSNESIFEIGCGYGACLKFISDNYKGIKIAGSDYSKNAIDSIQQTFPKGQFYLQNMIQKHPIPDNNFDIVISIGAVAMYLYKPEIIITIKELVRLTKPGGSIIITHFTEKDGLLKQKSIIEKIEKEFILEYQDYWGIENIIFFDMKDNIDRYGFSCNKKNIL